MYVKKYIDKSTNKWTLCWTNSEFAHFIEIYLLPFSYLVHNFHVHMNVVFKRESIAFQGKSCSAHLSYIFDTYTCMLIWDICVYNMYKRAITSH